MLQEVSSASFQTVIPLAATALGKSETIYIFSIFIFFLGVLTRSGQKILEFVHVRPVSRSI